MQARFIQEGHSVDYTPLTAKSSGDVVLVLLLAMYLLPFWYFCKRLRSPDIAVKALALCGSTLLASYFMFGMSQVILGRNNGVMFFAVSLAVLWAAMRQAEERG